MLAWVLRDSASGVELLQWCLDIPSLREDENIPVSVPHGWSLGLSSAWMSSASEGILGKFKTL